VTKFIDRLDLQIRLHLAVRNLPAIINYKFIKLPINNKLEKWHKLSWKEFLEELEFTGVLINNESDKINLKETFEEHKERILLIENELIRIDKIIAEKKNRI
jgi:hypothetical protein